MRFFSTKKVISGCSSSGQAFARNGRQYDRMMINVEDFSRTSLLRFGWLQIAGRRVSNAKFLNRFVRVTDQHVKLQILKGRTRATQKHKNAIYTQEERDPPVMDGRMQVGEWHVSVYACELCRKRAATWQARRHWSHSAKYKGKKELKIAYSARETCHTYAMQE